MKIMADTKPKLAADTASPEAFEAWRGRMRAKLSDLLGMGYMEMPESLNPQVLGMEKRPGHTRVKMTIATEPGEVMPFFLLLPDGIEPGERRPCVIAPHGHGSSGKDSPAGNARTEAVARQIAHYNYEYGVEAANRGFIALCPDARGFGERREKYWQSDDPEVELQSSCAYLNSMGYPLGRTVAGMWAWDLMRLADYAATRADADMGRLACIGLSGGGLQTLYFTALDERVRCAVISGYFYGFRESLLETFCCSCNYVPHLWEYADVSDIASLIAPRPLLIETGDEDDLNGKSNLGNVVPYVEKLRSAYALYGKSGELVHDIFHGPHRWHGEVSMPWLSRQLKNRTED